MAARRLRPAARRSWTDVDRAVVFKDGGNVATAKEFVRFLVGEGWLAHYLDFSGERMLPPMPKLLERRSGSTRATRTACARRCSS